MGRIIIIDSDSPDELKRQITEIFSGYNNAMSKEIIPTNHGEVCGKQFEEIMLEKGYKVSSIRSKKNKCAKFNVRMVKRNGEWWYNLEAALRVPRRR